MQNNLHFMRWHFWNVTWKTHLSTIPSFQGRANQSIYVKSAFPSSFSSHNDWCPFWLSGTSNINMHNRIDFLPDCFRRIRLQSYTSTVLRPNTGTPQGCALSPLFNRLYRYDCVAIHNKTNNKIIKFLDGSTMLRLILIKKGDMVNSDEVEQVSECAYSITCSSEPQKQRPLLLTSERAKQISSHSWSMGRKYPCSGFWTSSWSATQGAAGWGSAENVFTEDPQKYIVPQNLLLAFYHCCRSHPHVLNVCRMASALLQRRKALNGAARMAEKIISHLIY